MTMSVLWDVSTWTEVERYTPVLVIVRVLWMSKTVVDVVVLVAVRYVVPVMELGSKGGGDMYTKAEAAPTITTTPATRIPIRAEIPRLRLARLQWGLRATSLLAVEFKLTLVTQLRAHTTSLR